MPATTLSARKIRDIITLHALSHPSYRELSRLFDVSSSTVGKYVSAFERSSISLASTRRLPDELLRQLLSPPRPLSRSCRHQKLIESFPTTHQCLNNHATTLLVQWRNYRQQCPTGYCYSQFANRYKQWLSANLLQRPRRNFWAICLSIEDIKTLKEWRSSNNKMRWERAVALLDMHKGCTIASICRKLERSPKTIKQWRQLFLNQGLSSLQIPFKKACNEQRLAFITKKKDRLVKIIHESPSLHGVNRTTWTLETLAAAYRSVYGESVSLSSVSQYFNELGYKFKRARKVLTSPDPEYRTKLKEITAILSRLHKAGKVLLHR